MAISGKKIIIGAFIMALALYVSFSKPDISFAREFPAPFKIKAIFLSGANNYHFRVISNNPGTWLCHNGPINDPWAFVNENDSGAKTKISALLAAYSMGKTVSLITEGVADGAATYCRIVEFYIYD